MATVTEHYEHLLAPIYIWMAGGTESALQAGQAEIAELNLPLPQGATVVDLGAGFGMHAIPLARAGHRVLAIDASQELLHALDGLRGNLAIETICDELLNFQSHLSAPPAAVLCMGDTLTHLENPAEALRLIEAVAASLPVGGFFVLSFRDYSAPLSGDARFIPVRSDESRILTCFLEYENDAVIVHDILHQRSAEAWQTRVSHYRKLRLPPEQIITWLQAHGFAAHRESGLRGMVRIVARKSG